MPPITLYSRRLCDFLLYCCSHVHVCGCVCVCEWNYHSPRPKTRIKRLPFNSISYLLNLNNMRKYACLHLMFILCVFNIYLYFYHFLCVAVVCLLNLFQFIISFIVAMKYVPIIFHRFFHIFFFILSSHSIHHLHIGKKGQLLLLFPFSLLFIYICFFFILTTFFKFHFQTYC